MFSSGRLLTNYELRSSQKPVDLRYFAAAGAVVPSSAGQLPGGNVMHAARISRLAAIFVIALITVASAIFVRSSVAAAPLDAKTRVLAIEVRPAEPKHWWEHGTDHLHAHPHGEGESSDGLVILGLLAAGALAVYIGGARRG
jgi:hypothetical protein